MTHRHGCTARPVRCSRTSPNGGAPLGAPHSSLDGVAPSRGPPLFRRPLPDASPRWCPAPKPLVVVVSARAPCNGSSIPPADGWAQSARCLFCRDAARTWWAPCWNGLRGALVGRASRVRRCSARGSQADSDSKTDARYRIPRLLFQRHTMSLLTPGSSCTLDHRPHKHPDHPQSPCSSTARRPENCQNPKFLSLRSMLREGADNWSARLCVASRSAIKGYQRHEIHHNYLPLGVVFDLENNLVFSHLSLVFIGLVSPDHLLQLSGTCEVFCRYP